ncbi:MAG: tripartite tricarboxylate transporter substrate binding protein [Xanthobacteraceae bacterium]|jgi:tripartite-type tricarboxylate transporter receptor subunit TctC|nr:tripartite tricarboxylate transporter substrate binding protein [Xanthobacteraceae bacterium]
MTFRATLFGALAIAILGVAAPCPSAADTFPARPITLVIPFAAGGSTDLVGRLLAQHMSPDLGQPVVVENRPGAGGNVGASAVAKATPDGHTILMGTVATHALNPALYKKMPYDPVTSFAPVSLLAIVPNVLVVNPAFPAKTVKELIDLVKANPGQYTFASSGNGTPLHLSGALFNSMAGIDMQHIPYQGAGPALIDVLSNQVPVMFDNLPSSAGHIKTGKLRALGVTTAKRAPSFPDVPAIAETLPGYETYTWNALFAPAGTPPQVVARLNAVANKALADPQVQARLAEFSAIVVGSTPEELATHVKAELAKWAPIVKASGAQLD